MIHSFEFWMSAFIPKHVAGWKASPVDPTKTYIPAPKVGPWERDIGAYTDHRGFSANPTVSARLRAYIRVDVPGRRVTHAGVACEPSTHVFVDQKPRERFACQLRATPVVRRKPAVTFPGHGVDAVITFDCGNRNPCAPAVAPLIDMKGTVSVGRGFRALRYHLFTDFYPAYEAYARVNGSYVVTLLREMPLPGKSPWDLYGGARRPFRGSAEW